MNATAHSRWSCPKCDRIILSQPGLRPKRCNKCKTPGRELNYEGGAWKLPDEASNTVPQDQKK